MDWTKLQFGMILTKACNFRCSHCYSGDEHGETMADAEAVGILEGFKAKGGEFVGFCGGEVTLKMPLLKMCLNYCALNGIETNIISNGWWGRADKVDKYLSELLHAGLSRLQVSFDCFHAKFNSWDNVKRILGLACRSIPVGIVWVRHEADLVNEARELCGVDADYAISHTIATGRVVRIGRAVGLDYNIRLPLTNCQTMISDAPTVMMLPGNKFSYRCAVYAPHRTYNSGPDWTQTVEGLEASDATLYLKQYGFSQLLPKYDGRYYTPCDFCVGELR